MGRYISIALSSTFRNGIFGTQPSKSVVVLWVGGIMRSYLHIALYSHSKRENFGGLFGVLLVSFH